VDIGVTGRKIEAIDTAGSLKGANRIDVNDGLCLRPLSDSHLHLDKAGTVRASTKPPSSITEAIAAMRLIKQTAQRDPTGLQDRMTSTLRRLCRNGTRYVRALVDVDETWGLTGFKAALAARGAVPELKVKVIAFAQEGMTGKVAQLLSEAAATGADGIGGHTDVDADAKSHIRTAVRIARQARLPLEVHVDEPASAESFKLPMVLEEASGLSDLTLVHCLSLARLPETDQIRWIEEIKRSGATVVVATSVLLFGLPLAPVSKMLEAGVPVGLGSDNLQDVFVPMGTGRILETARTTGIVAGLGNFEFLTALLEGATGVGYRLVSGQDDKFVSGSSASFSVFTGSTAPAVMFGDDAIQLTVIDGKPEERIAP
jgi:cytosine/adenosine deaminase-related metal-dependent hydrolase